MTTNFFKNIADLNLTGNLNITIHPNENGKLTVSVLVINPKVNDTAVKSIPPLLLKGAPEELDNGFFEAIIQPLQQTDGILQNIADYQKGQDKARSSSKVGTEKKVTGNSPKDDIEVTTKPNAEEKKKEYIDAIRKITELTAMCKYEEALEILPKVEDFPDKEVEILKRKADLERMNMQKQLLWNE